MSLILLVSRKYQVSTRFPLPQRTPPAEKAKKREVKKDVSLVHIAKSSKEEKEEETHIDDTTSSSSDTDIIDKHDKFDIEDTTFPHPSNIDSRSILEIPV